MESAIIEIISIPAYLTNRILHLVISVSHLKWYSKNCGQLNGMSVEVEKIIE